jgi:hypothetical protein
MIAPRPACTDHANGSSSTGGGHEDRHAHGFGDAERSTVHRGGCSFAIHGCVVDGCRDVVAGAPLRRVVSVARPWFCVTAAVTVTVFVTVVRRRGSCMLDIAAHDFCRNSRIQETS